MADLAARRRARHGSIRTPGLRMPAGSTAALAARRAAAKGSGRWRSYQGRWSRPTAWWWRDRAAPGGDRLGGRRLDLVPLGQLVAAARGREHGEVGRRTVGIDVGEPARHDPVTSERLPCPFAHGADELLEAVPRDRGLEGLDEDARGDERVAEVGRLEEGVAPGGLGRAARPRGTSPAVARRPRGPRTARARGSSRAELVVGGLEAEHQQRGRRPLGRALGRRAGQGGLLAVEQPAVRRVEAGLRQARARPARRTRTSRTGPPPTP